MGSLFRNQTFPKNWQRCGTAAGFDAVGADVDKMIGLYPEVLPCANDTQGVCVADNMTGDCHITPCESNVMDGVTLSLTCQPRRRQTSCYSSEYYWYSHEECRYSSPATLQSVCRSEMPVLTSSWTWWCLMRSGYSRIWTAWELGLGSTAVY